MPIGSKTCDMCAVTGAIAPVGQPQPWQAPRDAVGPEALASSAASWAGGYQGRPSLPLELEKARKQVGWAARYFAVIGGLSAGLGICAELFEWTSVLGFFNWFSAIEGAIFVVLAYFARGASVVAIGIGAGLYFLDTLALLLSGHFSLFRLLILAVLIRAVLAANMVRKHAAASRAQDQSRAA
ncbi:MAG: hypothetical protein M3077_05145 [Candidatus Dormibacteraeota bacterium]|nr:hypothetical protein [Candidatus Dormibacteraeota bacterium]